MGYGWLVLFKDMGLHELPRFVWVESKEPFPYPQVPLGKAQQLAYPFIKLELKEVYKAMFNRPK
jgi:hypothetical protein